MIEESPVGAHEQHKQCAVARRLRNFRDHRFDVVAAINRY
jgi:hypothetical protein